MGKYSRKLDRLEERYEKKLERVKYKNKKEEYKNKLIKESEKVSTVSPLSRWIKKMGTTKLLVFFVEFDAIVVQVWAMIEIHISQDLSSIPYFVTAVLAEAIALAIFFIKKSTAENTEGGIVYEMAMKGLDKNNPSSKSAEIDSDEALG